MYKTIICKETKEQFYGEIIETPRQHTNNRGEIVDYWTFKTHINGKSVIWECLSDYWELVHADLRKVEKAFEIDEEENKENVLDTIKKILKWGYCK